MATTDDPDQKLADTEGRPDPGGRARRGHPRRAAGPGPGEEGEIRLKGPQVIRGYLDPSLDAEAFDDGRATSAAAISASSTPRGS